MSAYLPECKRKIRCDRLTCEEFFFTSDNGMAIWHGNNAIQEFSAFRKQLLVFLANMTAG